MSIDRFPEVAELGDVLAKATVWLTRIARAVLIWILSFALLGVEVYSSGPDWLLASIVTGLFVLMPTRPVAIAGLGLLFLMAIVPPSAIAAFVAAVR